MAGIYLHIPFCKRICGYCDFFKSIHLSQLNNVVDEMLCEIEDEHDFIHDKNIETIYFGGGTPSLLHVEQIKLLLEKCHEIFDTSNLKEVTLEINPDDINEEYLSDLINIGINRLSIGVQSFNDEILKFMNRRHSAAQAIQAVELARKVGFENISIDLIFGIDKFPTSYLEKTITQTLSLGIEHISAYHLTIESGTEFARRLNRGEITIASEEQSQKEFQLLHSHLCDAGYEHYEISSYALPDKVSRHNSSYWRGVEYIGIGAGAHSFNGEVRRAAKPSIEEYLRGGDNRYEVEHLTPQERYNEYIMTSLRWREGVNTEQLKRDYATQYINQFNRNAANWISSGKLVRDREIIKIPPKHYLLSDMIIESLLVV